MPQQPGFFSDPIGFFREGAEQNAARAGVDEFGNRNDPGWLNNAIGALTGATDKGTQEYVQAQKNQKNKLTYKGDIEGLGGTFTPGMSSGQYVAEIDRLTQLRNNNNYANSPAGKAAAAQLALTNKRLDNQMEMALLDRADSKELQANQLEYQKMRDRRADIEYNERMERLDRKDRQAMMQNLAAGLAALGAAFAA